MKILAKIIIVFLIGISLSQISNAVELVTDADIKALKDKTEIFKLSNGIPVIYRQETSSDIIHLAVSFDWALKDQKSGTKTLPDIVMSLLTMGSKSYPQEKLYEIVEKYSLVLGCAASIDRSSCHFETINDHFEKNISLLSSSIIEPSFSEKDLKNIVDKAVAAKKSEIGSPDYAVNQAVNKIYYDKAHPYVLDAESAIKEFNSFQRKDLIKGHKELLNADRISMAIVTSLPIKTVKRILEKEFSSLKSNPHTRNVVDYPASSKESISVVERDIPTAYIKVKIPAPNMTAKESSASRLLFEILSEEMALEIRTKRSLSYAAYAYTGQGQIGLGVFSISTPKPKESLDVLASILNRLKTEKLADEIFEEYKRTFATGYFLSQETHSSMTTMLLKSYYYTGDVDYVYELPKKLQQVKASDVQDLAKKILKDFKVGVLGKKSQVNSGLGSIL